MNNEEVINKIINNHKMIVKRTLKIDDTEYTFDFKKLTNKQLNDLEELSTKGLKFKINPNNGKFLNDKEITASTMQDNNNEVIKKSIEYSLDISSDIVDSLPAGLPLLLYETIIDISTINKEEEKQLKSFQ